jgi:hypothetical protein
VGGRRDDQPAQCGADLFDGGPLTDNAPVGFRSVSSVGRSADQGRS